MEAIVIYPKLYALVGAPYGHIDRVVIQMSFDKDELERMKAAIESQVHYFTLNLEVCEVDDRIAEQCWPKKTYSY